MTLIFEMVCCVKWIVDTRPWTHFNVTMEVTGSAQPAREEDHKPQCLLDASHLLVSSCLLFTSSVSVTANIEPGEFLEGE